MSLSLPESSVSLESVDPDSLREHGEQVQRNFDRISGQWLAFPRIIRGRVNGAAPTILQGTGFSVTKLFVGVYTVTFDAAFAVTPIAVLTTEIIGSARLGNLTVGSLQVALENNAGALVDGIFTFIAMES